MSAPVITLDGPGGAGKGTLAAALAERLGWRVLDSGALYRLVALLAARRGLDPEVVADQAIAAAAARRMDFAFVPQAGGGQQIRLAGEDVTAAIRAADTADGASRWAAVPAIRDALLARQREMATPPGLIADGRDTGTVVFPEAALKIFVTASARARAERRAAQLPIDATADNITTIYNEIIVRDARDRARSAAPLRPAEDAVVIDTTQDNVAQSITKVLDLVAARL